MAISGTDLTNMRTGQQLVKPHLNVTPKVVIATMQINQASFSYPLAQVTVDNTSINGGLAFADIPVGSLVFIGTTAGAHDVTTSVVRKSPSGTTLFISAIGKGDPGYAQYTHTALADDQYITILAVKPLWSLLSRISSSTFYKRYDVAYVDEGDDPVPVCNIGPWKRIELTGATVTETFTNAAITDVKPASFAWGAKTKSSYAWTTRNSSYALNTGCSFDGGVDNTEGVSITWDTAGFYIIYCTLTDSGGKTHTAETYVWVVDGSTESDLTGWYLEQDKHDLEGRQITFGRYGDTAESVVFPGAGFLYTEAHTFNDTTVTAGTTVTTFAGYVKTEQPKRDITRGLTSFEVIGPAHMLKEIPMASQYIIEVSSPTNWTQVSSDLSHPSGVAWYLLQHHCPMMLQVFDFAFLEDPSDNSMDTDNRDHIWTFTGKDLWSQVSEILKQQLNIGCDSQGALYLRHKPQYMTAADRNLVDERMTWTERDIRESLEYSQTIRVPVGMVDGYAFAYNGANVTPYWGRAPNDTQGQGKSTQTVNSMVVPVATAQTDVNRTTGHIYAEVNSPTPNMTLKAMRNMDTMDPARMVWHKLNVGSTYDPRGVGWSNQRFLPIKVARKWERQNSGAWIKHIDATIQIETTGQPAATKQVPVSTEDDWGEFGDWFDPFAWGDIITDDLIYNPALKAGLTAMVAMNSDGYLYITTDYETVEADGGPTWARTNLSLSGTPVCFVVDAFSDGYTGAGTQIDGWVATTTSIYKVNDLFGVPTPVLQHSFAEATSLVNIDFSWGLDGWGVCVIHYPRGAAVPGTFTTYTTDGGSSWSVEAAITSFSQQYPSSQVGTPGLYVSPRTAGLAYTAAYTADASSAPAAFYKSTDYGATWAQDATVGVNPGYNLGFDFHVPYNDNDDEDIVFHTRAAAYSFNQQALDLYRAASGVDNQEISTDGPGCQRWAIASSPNNRQYMTACTQKQTGTGDVNNRTYLNTSVDGGETWTQLVEYARGTTLRCAISGNDSQTFFLFGSDIMQYSNNFGSTRDDRWGNLDDFVPLVFIGIAGGTS